MLRIAILFAFSTLILTSCQNVASDRLALMGATDTTLMLDLSEAVAIAQEQVPNGFAMAVELELEDDDENEPPAYEVLFYESAEDQLIEVEVHAFTGDVLEVEVEEDGGDDDD